MKTSRSGLRKLLLSVVASSPFAVAAQDTTALSDGRFYAPLPQAATPFHVGESPTAWLMTKPSAVVTETEVGFDTRAVTVRQYLKGNAEQGLDSVVLWQAYYPELSDYLADALLEKRRELVWKEMTKRTPKDTSTQATRFELPVKVPDWAMRLGVDKPSLSLTGDYKFRIKSESQWKNTDDNPSRMPGFEPDQEPNINLVGTIGKLIHVQLTWTKDGFGVSNNQLLQIRYAGEKPEDTEDDILQEAEFGYINFSMPGTQLTGYTEQASGLIGLKAKLRFGDLDMTLIGGGEKGEKQRQKLGASSVENTQKIDDRSPSQGAWFLDQTYRGEFTTYGGNYQAMEAPASVRLFTRITVTEQRNNPTWAPFLHGQAFAYDAAGAKTSLATKEKELWVELRSTDFTVKGGVVFLNNTTLASTVYGSNGALAAIYSAHGKSFGSYSTEDAKFALLFQPNDPIETRPLALRNRYRLPFTSISANDRQYMKVRILEKSNRSDQSVDANGVDWTKVFGLADATGQLKTSDVNIFDWERMEISFPMVKPFADQGRNDLYDTARTSLSSLAERFTIEVTSKSRKSVFQIGGSSNVSSSGCMDIIDGSEVLTLNGSTTLVRGTDYEVIYNIGQITLVSARALDPSADISIDYQCTPFFSLETKTLLGGRLEYELPVGKPKESLLGATLLYRSETVTDPRPQLKREPNLSWLWGANLRLQSESEWLTDLAGYVPLVTPHGESRWKLELEGAQTYNDPNTGDEALVDDFENSKVENSLPLTRTSWYPASPPGGVPKDGAEYDTLHNYWHQGRFVWHSNSQVALADIYPNWDDGTGTRARQSILQMKLQPNDPGLGYSWGGIMRPFADKDLSKSKVIEVVVRGSGGVLNIDLGDISEDISIAGRGPNDSLNSEDIDSTGYQTGRPPLKDLGLDGIPDELEVAQQWYCPGTQCGSPTLVTSSQANDPAGKQYRAQADASDPDGAINGTEGNNRYVDNGANTWFDSEDLNRNGKLDMTNAFNRFTIHLGGDSATSYEPLKNGWRLYRIRLENPSRKVAGGAKWNSIAMMRMWYSGLTSANGANQQEERLQLARVAMVGNQWTESGRISRNDSIWVGDSLYTGGFTHRTYDTIKDTNSLRVSIVNKQENSDVYLNWGVQPTKDASTGAVANEQSLKLEYRGLRAFGELDSAAGTATRSFSDARDFTLYKRFQLMVYHRLTAVQIGSDTSLKRLADLRKESAKPLRMAVRMGSGTPDDTTAEYYEYSWNLFSMDCALGDATCKDDVAVRTAQMSWNWENNRLDVPLGVFTALKDSGSVALRKTRIYRSKVDEVNLPAGLSATSLAHRQDSVLIKGNPSLSNIQWIRYILRPDSLGSNERISGEVWVNDLKLNDPQRGIGTAVRGSFEFNLADLFSASASASLTEGNFVPMGQRRVEVSKAATAGSASFDTRLSLNKFLPESWKVAMPIGYGVQTSISRPWMRPGSDRPLTHDNIGDIVGDLFTGELNRDSGEQARNTSRGYQTLKLDKKVSWSYKKDVTTDRSLKGYFVNLLFERPQLSWIYRNSGSQQPERLDTSTQHDVQFDYDLSPGYVPSWKVFDKAPAWAPGVFGQLEFKPWPSRINAVVASINYQESSRRTLDPDNDTLIGSVDRQKSASMSHSINTDWDPVGFLKLSHRLQVGRSFDRSQAHAFNPAAGFPGLFDLALAHDTTVTDTLRGTRQAFGLLKGEQSRTQSMTMDFSPQLAGWLTTTGTFTSSATFTRQSPLILAIDTASDDTTRVSLWRSDVRDGFRSQMRLNIPTLLASTAALGSGGFSQALLKVKKGLDAWKFGGIGVDYSVDNNSSGNQASLGRMENNGLDAWGLERYFLGLGDAEGFRTPWDLVTGSRSKEGFGQYQPSRLADTSILNASRRDMRTSGADFSTLADQRSYRVSANTDFGIPRLDLTLRPTLSYSTSWEERWNDPVNVDTTTTWPQVGLGADWANFVPKFSVLGKWFQRVTMNHSVAWDITEVVHPHSSTSDRRDESWKFAPLVGINLQTKNGLWTFDNKVNYTTTTSTNLLKAQDSVAPVGVTGVLNNPIYWYHQSGTSQDNGMTVGDEFSATYRVQTKKGIQILKWFFKLESDLVITFSSSWSHQTKDQEVRNEMGAVTQAVPQLDQTNFKTGASTSYSFTPKLTATASGYYTRTETKLSSASELPTISNAIQMLFEVVYRF